jgi:hypothetical protein
MADMNELADDLGPFRGLVFGIKGIAGTLDAESAHTIRRSILR